MWIKWSKPRSCGKHCQYMLYITKHIFYDGSLLHEYLNCVIHQIITGHCFHTILKWFRITDSVNPFPWDTTLKTLRFIINDSSLSLSRAFKVSRNVQHFIMRTCLRDKLHTTHEKKKFPHISIERKYDPFPCHTQLFTKLQFFFTLYKVRQK